MIRRLMSSFCNRICSRITTLPSNQLNGKHMSAVAPVQLNSTFPHSSVVGASASFNALSHISIKLLEPNQVVAQQKRTVTRYSWKNGTRKSVKAVKNKFFRLHWGIWIRTMAGRHKRLWKKSQSQRNRLLQHVFCNCTQSKMLDKMMSDYWLKPKFYLEDPYEPYHKREQFASTRKKAWRPYDC